MELLLLLLLLPPPPYPGTASNSLAFGHMGERARDNTIAYPACMHACMYVMYVSWDLEREDDCLVLARSWTLGDRPNVTKNLNIEKVCSNNAFKVHIGGGAFL
jgi:hypothetical protein